MYKYKFKSRREAFDYTQDKLPDAKSKDIVLSNYANALQQFPCDKSTITQIRSVPPVLCKAFQYTEGNVSITELRVNKDGTVDM